MVRVWERVSRHRRRRSGRRRHRQRGDRAASRRRRSRRADHDPSTRPEPTASPKSRPARGIAGFDAIVNVQGDEPFVSEAAVRGAAEIVTSGAISARHAAAPAPPDVLGRPHVVKVVTRRRRARAVLLARADSVAARPRATRPSATHRPPAHRRVRLHARRARRWVALPHASARAHRAARTAAPARRRHRHGRGRRATSSRRRRRHRRRSRSRQRALDTNSLPDGPDADNPSTKSHALHLRHRRRRLVAREGHRRRVARPAARRARPAVYDHEVRPVPQRRSGHDVAVPARRSVRHRRRRRDRSRPRPLRAVHRPVAVAVEQRHDRAGST